MPVVIKELIVKAQVDNAPKNTRRELDSGDLSLKAKDALLEECVEAVLEVLRQKEER